MGILFLTQDQGKLLGPFVWLLGVVLNALFNFLEMFHIDNAAVAIILFTFLVNALMIPMTVKQQKWSKLQSRMSPELTKIQQKYKGKTDEASMRSQQAETKAVYEKFGTSPTGGCLPMLITLPILLALYRVIGNIPAYVDSIKVVYEGAAEAIKGCDGYVQVMSQYVEQVKISTKSWGDISTALSTDANSTNYIIDILAKFKSDQWSDLASQFPAIGSTITETASKISHVNSFFGMNIADSPKINSMSVVIPIFSVLTQLLNTRMIMPPKTDSVDNPAAASMQTVNNVMPFVSGFMCFMLPIGVGIYWVAGSVFRITQQFFVNRYMRKIDVDSIIEKNLEKANKKKAKLGSVNSESVQKVAMQRTSTIQDKSNAVKNSNNKVVNEPKEVKDYKKGETNYDPGSISSIANILSGKKDSSKGE